MLRRARSRRPAWCAPSAGQAHLLADHPDEGLCISWERSSLEDHGQLGGGLLQRFGIARPDVVLPVLEKGVAGLCRNVSGTATWNRATSLLKAKLNLTGPDALKGDLKIAWPTNQAGAIAKERGTIGGHNVALKMPAPFSAHG